MFSPNSGLKWVEIVIFKGNNHFLLKNPDLVKILNSALGDKYIAKIKLHILQFFAPIFSLLSTPYFYKGFIGWLGKLWYTCAGIILPQNKIAIFIHSKSTEFVYSMPHKGFIYMIYKIKSNSYLKLLYI